MFVNFLQECVNLVMYFSCSFQRCFGFLPKKSVTSRELRTLVCLYVFCAEGRYDPVLYNFNPVSLSRLNAIYRQIFLRNDFFEGGMKHWHISDKDAR